MTRIKDENYICIQGWMINRLNLKGNELLVYAIIYGFSQDEKSRFTGSLQYLADWTNSSKQGVMKNLKSLADKGYIEKTDRMINGVKFCEYHTTELNGVLNNVEQGMKQSLIGGIKHSLPNNIDINNIKNNIDDNIYSHVIELYHEHCPSLPKIVKLTDARKKTIRTRLKTYTECDLVTAFDKAEASDFLRKGSGTWNGASFDWIMNPRNIVKILEGNYDNKPTRGKEQELDSFYDMANEWAKKN